MHTPERQRISYAKKSGRLEPHMQIDSIVLQHHDGTPRTLSQQEAIDNVRKGRWIFYAMIDGRDLWVRVERDADGNEFITTQESGYQPNGLLKLSESPQQVPAGYAR
jgi:hypothetical protein